MTVAFEIEGQPFTALNGGPLFKFNESVSFVVHCADQAEVDNYWERLTEGGGQEVQCGWLRDRYGLSWQVVPDALLEMTGDPDPEKVRRVTEAMLQMRKMEVDKLEEAANAA
mgnify:CR=1 FL=1